MPSLLEAAESGLARIVFTGSYGHKNSALNFDDLNLKSGYNTLKALWPIQINEPVDGAGDSAAF